MFPGWTHGACGAVWARLRRAAGPVLPRLRPNVSSCRGPVDPRPASCSGRRRTEWPAPAQREGQIFKIKLHYTQEQVQSKSCLKYFLYKWDVFDDSGPIPPPLRCRSSSSVCPSCLWQDVCTGFLSRPAAASPALMDPSSSWGLCWRRTNTAAHRQKQTDSSGCDGVTVWKGFSDKIENICKSFSWYVFILVNCRH